MRVLVFGAGAIGTYIGGSLGINGNQVTFVERPDVAEELKQRGLRLNILGKVAHIPSPNIAGSINEAFNLGPYDFAIFALKSYDTWSALESLRLYADTLPPILCLQNGVDNEPALQDILGKNKVIAGTVTSAIGRNAAGDITLERLRGIGVATDHILSVELVEAFNQAGLKAKLYLNGRAMKWSKLLTNLIANATSAILDMTPADIFTHSGLYRLEVMQLREALAVMDSKRIPVINLPATPVKLLALGVHFPLWFSRPLFRSAVGSGRGGKMPSLHIDLYNHREVSEVKYLNGAVVNHARDLTIPTPVNRFLNETLLKMVSGELPLNTFAQQPEKLLAQFEQILED